MICPTCGVNKESTLSSAKLLIKERDALLADNERLRDAVNKIGEYSDDNGEHICCSALANEPHRDYCLVGSTLAATPAQSLARIRNQVRDECAALSERRGDIGTATVIRTTKEPE